MDPSLAVLAAASSSAAQGGVFAPEAEAGSGSPLRAATRRPSTCRSVHATPFSTASRSRSRCHRRIPRTLLVSRRPLMIGVDDHRQQAFAAVLVSSTAARRFRGECQPAARARACGRRPPDAGVPLRSFAPSMLAAARPSTRVASSQFCSSLTAADAPVGRVRLSPRRQRRRSTCSMAQHTCPCCGLICRKVKILFWHMDRHTRAPLCARLAARARSRRLDSTRAWDRARAHARTSFVAAARGSLRTATRRRARRR